MFDKSKIIMIDSADPGFDWIFNCKIVGLITKFGGTNSHMAIRCAELNLPSLIGVGERNFNKMIGYKSLSLDCLSSRSFRVERIITI